MFTVLAGMAQFERDIIRENSMLSLLSKAAKGQPATRLPYGRKWNPEKERFELIKDKAAGIKAAARAYLKDTPLRKAAQLADLSYQSLSRIFRNSCSDKWHVHLYDQDFVYTVPPLLDQRTLARVHAKMKLNQRAPEGRRKYLLSPHLKCYFCSYTLTGRTIKGNGSKYYGYYAHQMPARIKNSCSTPIRSLPADLLEETIKRLIGDLITDHFAYEDAIEEALKPDELRATTEERITANTAKLKQISKNLEKLVEVAIAGTLSPKTISNKEKKLLDAKEQLEIDIADDQHKLNSIPDRQQLEEDAEKLKLAFETYFSSAEHFSKLSDKKWKNLLDDLFSGHDIHGIKRAIYLRMIDRQWLEINIHAKNLEGSINLNLKTGELSYRDPSGNSGNSGGGDLIHSHKKDLIRTGKNLDMRSRSNRPFGPPSKPPHRQSPPTGFGGFDAVADGFFQLPINFQTRFSEKTPGFWYHTSRSTRK